MAQNITIAGAAFSDVPAIVVPATGGGQAVFADPSDTTAVAADVTQGKTFLTAQGTYDTGTASGGSPASVPSKDVDFYDYDGTRVYSYTASEFAALTEMPANPDHSHDAVPLTSQGWNWTLSEAKAQLQETGYVSIGAFYNTTDGANKAKVVIDERKDVKLRSYKNANDIYVDWGDGTTDTISGAAATVYPQHTYTAPGEYVISITGSGNYLAFTGNVQNGYSPEKSYPLTAYISPYCDSLQGFCYQYCMDLQAVAVRSDVYRRVREGAFMNCYSLKHMTVPVLLTSLSVFETNLFRGCTALQSVSFSPTLWKIASQTFYQCYSIRKICIPSSVTTIELNAFYECMSLESITLPSAVTSIGTYAFYNCKSLKEIHMRPTTPPTLSSTNAFSGIASDCIIYVPRGKLNTYKTATNWSSYASKMQEEPA